MNILELILSGIIGFIIGFIIALIWRKRQTEIILKARDELWDELRGKLK